MAQNKQKQLDGDTAKSIAQIARRDRELATIAEIADSNLNPKDHWRSVLPEHIEAIKTRLLGGDTLRRTCRALGLDPASVTRNLHENPELLAQYLDWKAFGTHALYENLLELPFDPTMSDADKLLYYKVVSNYAPKMNRQVYGDKVQVDVVEHKPVILDWNIIEGDGGDGV
ncbi:hypothetical protein [Sphingomonas sp. BAUL-RG-20F-R05-02]|uniref:terminase small subunit-like protein n=1 Tax=Sphingomonas sp. BAUL-RG-20F-R05-02 TaxID=2914830 RepID=UPI001F5A609E|nr:hypothetical protein [Sphingomonas sp. BAUL-RG-20F-R05-02]